MISGVGRFGAWEDRHIKNHPDTFSFLLAKAVGYLRNQWDGLRTYLTDGRVPINNNDVEQLMKQVALGRKNWLFVGSVDAGRRAADFMTLVSSAIRNDLDVWAYLKDILDRLLAGETDYAALRPDARAAAHPDSIREYRVNERRDRADRKQHRRVTRRRKSKSETALPRLDADPAVQPMAPVGAYIPPAAQTRGSVEERRGASFRSQGIGAAPVIHDAFEKINSLGSLPTPSATAANNHAGITPPTL